MLHVKEVFRHACVPVDFEEVRVSAEAPEDDVHNAIMAIRRNGVAIKGNIETNHNLPPSHKSRNNLIRTSLDLYANVIHCRSLPGVETRHRDIDILIVRENTEGEYSSLEHESVAGVVESLKIITAGRSRRIAHYAFRLARAAGRRAVTAVHKANIMKLGDGLFLQCCREVAAEYPEISFSSMIVDNTTMQLVSRPQQFDVMVMPNLYGNIVNNVCAGLVGGPGLVPGANYGHDYAVFETAAQPRLHHPPGRPRLIGRPPDAHARHRGTGHDLGGGAEHPVPPRPRLGAWPPVGGATKAWPQGGVASRSGRGHTTINHPQ
uniref:Isocitrate dehydrogenase (NAD(+)) 3 non-catalytic subunit gamma n=1 Tax=Cairina moschata TaxID=8855 RepID=A0A8C3BJW8_CAIMO